MKLSMTYKDGYGNLTTRIISDLEIIDENTFKAHCHKFNEERTFLFSRVVSAKDEESGEPIADIAVHMGILNTSFGKTYLYWPKDSKRERVSMTAEQAKRRKNDDQYRLFKPFCLEILKKEAKNKLKLLYDSKCFNCGRSTQRLQMDHHVPQCLGGRLVPHNIVLLCPRCNNFKGTKEPEEFYSEKQLLELEKKFAEQEQLFSFKFDWSKWNDDRKNYLLELGLDPEFVESIMYDKDHPNYIGKRPEPKYTITVSLEDLLKGIDDGVL